MLTLALLKLQLTADEALRAATLGDAYSLRRQDEIGSPEVGKRCDLAVLEARRYQESPTTSASTSCGPSW